MAESYCRSCCCPRARCVLWLDRKCCPDCTCDGWRYVFARQLGLPFPQLVLNLEPLLRPELVSSILTVTRGGRTL